MWRMVFALSPLALAVPYILDTAVGVSFEATTLPKASLVRLHPELQSEPPKLTEAS